MANLIFAISRTYGSGGRVIGKRIAEMLDFNFYDKDLLKLASDESGISEQLFNLADEYKKTSIFKPISVYKDKLFPPNSDNFVSEDNLFNYQAKVIKELAQKSSCVIMGRCADYILKDSEQNVVKAFIHAPLDCCIENVCDMYSISEKEAQKRIEKIDKERYEYHKYYTGKSWNDVSNYDICLDSSVLGFEKTARVLIDYAKTKFNIQ